MVLNYSIFVKRTITLIENELFPQTVPLISQYREIPHSFGIFRASFILAVSISQIFPSEPILPFPRFQGPLFSPLVSNEVRTRVAFRTSDSLQTRTPIQQVFFLLSFFLVFLTIHFFDRDSFATSSWTVSCIDCFSFILF